MSTTNHHNNNCCVVVNLVNELVSSMGGGYDE